MQQNNQPAEGSRFELWMVANLAVGMGQFVFVPLLAGLSMLVFYTGEPFGRIP